MQGKTRIALALLVGVLVGGCGAAHPVRPALPRVPFARHVLPNGVRVIIEPRPASEVAAVQLWVRAGGRDESAGELGLAHYLEHMLFKGTTMRPAGFVGREVEGAGGRMNAGTSLDYTYYHLLLPAGRVSSAIEMLADIVANATLDEAELEREKRVVLEEMRQNEDAPTSFLMRKLYEAVLDGHPYGRPVIGTPEAIRGLAREQLLGFYRRHYVPESFTLVVVGSARPDEVLATAARTFGRLPRRGGDRLPAPVPAVAEARRLEIRRPGSHAYLALGWMAPRLDHADTPAVELLVSILGRGKSSRLGPALRDRLGLVNAISAGYAVFEAAGIVWVTAQLEPRHVADAERRILEEIQRLREQGVHDSERERAVTAAEARRALQAEAVEGRAHLLGYAETVWRVEEELAYLDRLRSVTGRQIRAAAERYLDPDRYARVVLLPGSPR